MNIQQAWNEVVMTELKDPQTWEALKDKPLQDRVAIVLDVFGKMYQQPDNPYEIIGNIAGLLRNNVSKLDLSRVEKKQGKAFIIAVIGIVQQHFDMIISEIKLSKKEIKR